MTTKPQTEQPSDDTCDCNCNSACTCEAPAIDYTDSCRYCSGSGEGLYENTRCPACKGSGEAPNED